MFKKKGEVGYFLVVDWTEDAVNNAVGADFLKVIHHINGKYIVRSESYSRVKIEQYLQNKTVVIDKTMGQAVPENALIIPKSQQFLGIVQLSGRMP